jgi:hypothetical protein
MINCSKKPKVKTIFGNVLFTLWSNSRLSRRSYPEDQRVNTKRKKFVRKVKFTQKLFFLKIKLGFSQTIRP